jgi:hypothetical protein
VRDAVEALGCDEPGCEEEIWGAASRLVARAEDRGWQVNAVIDVRDFGDTVSISRTDRCPAHHCPALSPQQVTTRGG